MRIVTIVFAFVLAACGSTPPAAAPQVPPSPDAALPAAEPQASTPASVQVPAPAPAARLENPAVAVSSEPFPIVTSLVLRARPIDQQAIGSADRAVTSYLASLDRYRDNNFDPAELRLTGAFRDAVDAGLKGSATPGVKRKFVLESLRVDRLFEKPWGTRALAEVTATVLDRAVSGSAPDQRETGRLLLTGERNMHVSDAWDSAGGRWFNGTTSPGRDEVRRAVVEPLGFFLRLQSWVPGSPPESWRQGEPTPFSSAHSARVAAIDRTRTISRTFDAVRAKVERYDTFDRVPTGLATVRVSATIISTDAQGSTDRTAFERRLKVLLFGGWMPEVVDEEIAPGVWLSGGDLALEHVDVNRA